MPRGSLFDNDEIFPDDDFIDSGEELGVDYHDTYRGQDFNGSSNAGHSTPIQDIEENRQEENARSSLSTKKITVKTMPNGIQSKFPNTKTILLTQNDGTQLLLVAE
jgi:hypothetical protein